MPAKINRVMVALLVLNFVILVMLFVLVGNLVTMYREINIELGFVEPRYIIEEYKNTSVKCVYGLNNGEQDIEMLHRVVEANRQRFYNGRAG